MCATHLTHDDGSLDGQLQVLQGHPDHGDHSLHPIDLLPQEDVHRSDGPHLLQPLFDFVGDVVAGELGEHVLRLSLHDALSRLSASRRAVLGLDGEDGVQTGLGRVALVPEGVAERGWWQCGKCRSL